MRRLPVLPRAHAGQLRLTPHMVVLGQGYALLLLGATKRGVEYRILLTNPTVVRWLAAYMAWKKAPYDERMVSVSYWRFNRLLRDSASP